MRNWKRYVMVLLLGVFIFFLFYSGVDNSKSAADIFAPMKEIIKEDDMTELARQELMRYYNINSADVEGFVLYGQTDSLKAGEVLVIKAKSEKQLRELQEAVENRKQEQLAIFESIDTKQTTLLNQAVVVTRGRFLLFAVGEHGDELAAAFREAVR